MKTFFDYIKESVISLPRNSLDPNVFTFPEGMAPILNTGIKKQILADVDGINKYLTVKDFYMVGSILTKSYAENSDIDINVEVYKEDVDDVVQLKLLSIIKQMNGKLATGTSHPINYYIQLEDRDDDNFDGIYDVINEKWVKEPKSFSINIQDYANNFTDVVSKLDLATGELRRELIDFEELSRFTPDNIKDLKELMQSKLYEINRSIENLVGAKKLIHHSRKEAFARAMTPDEIRKYRTKNGLPENVVYKLMQKYYYFDFIDKLEAILGKDEEISKSDIKDIKKATKALVGESFAEFCQTPTVEPAPILVEKIRTIKLKKIRWGDDKSLRGSHIFKNRGMVRKNLRQVPDSQRPDMQDGSLGAVLSAKKSVETAKVSPSGIWKVTPSQVKWIANKYHHIAPDQFDNIKHLGNTGIMVWRKSDNNFYLVKKARHTMRPKRHKHKI